MRGKGGLSFSRQSLVGQFDPASNTHNRRPFFRASRSDGILVTREDRIRRTEHEMYTCKLEGWFMYRGGKISDDLAAVSRPFRRECSRGVSSYLAAARSNRAVIFY